MIAPGLYVDPDASAMLARTPAPRPVLFLDRDGVVNVDSGYVHRPDETEWIPGIFELCRRARDAGMLAVVATNQAGIARGLYSEDKFLEYTRWMHRQFATRGTPLLASVYCPHHPDAGVGALRIACDCRKPAPGMIIEAARRFEVDLPASVLVGNNESDMQAARAASVGACVLLDVDPGPAYDGVASWRVDSLAEISLAHGPKPAAQHVRHAS